eukprot:scaffold14314_cov63-Phaeocystis_antarctica.AAC.1
MSPDPSLTLSSNPYPRHSGHTSPSPDRRCFLSSQPVRRHASKEALAARSPSPPGRYFNSVYSAMKNARSRPMTGARRRRRFIAL